MRKADLYSGALVIAFCLVLLFVIIPTWVPRHEEGGYGLGARVMPNVTATLAIALAAILFGSRLVSGLREKEDATAEPTTNDPTPPMSRSNWIFLSATSLFFVALIALFDRVGFLAAGPLTIAGFMIGMGERRPVPIVLISVGAAGAIWLFFWQLLRFPLP